MPTLGVRSQRLKHNIFAHEFKVYEKCWNGAYNLCDHRPEHGVQMYPSTICQAQKPLSIRLRNEFILVFHIIPNVSSLIILYRTEKRRFVLSVGQCKLYLIRLLEAARTFKLSLTLHLFQNVYLLYLKIKKVLDF